MSERLAWVDGLRGVAVLLMVADHLLRIDPDLLWLSQTVTRPALPIFMILVGYCWRGYSWRYVQVVAAAAVTWPVVYWIYGVQTPVLVVLVAVLAVVPLLARFPVVGGALAVLQVSAWPLPVSGYEPGTLAVLILGGLLARRASLAVPGWLLSVQWPGPVLWAGRNPLSIYVGHLLALAALALALTV